MNIHDSITDIQQGMRMIKEVGEPHCNNEDCLKFYSCKNLWDRFRVTNCIPNRQEKIDRIHKQELKEREEMLKGVFSCRLQGKRANKAKKMITELLENDTGEES